MYLDNQNDNKLAWVTPRLIEYGDAREITQQQNKTFGPTDGFLFQGQPIANAS